MGSGSTPNTYRGIQALRGIAALMVVVCHSTLFWARITHWADVPNGGLGWSTGAAGVDIFFFISGFVMMVSTSNGKHGPRAAGSFIERRALRIFPMYWFITGLFIVEYLIVWHHPELMTGGEIYVRLTHHLEASSLLLFPSFVLPIVKVSWTLTIECFFYLLFALALALKISPLRLLTPILLVLAIIGLMVQPTWPYYVISICKPVLLEFVGGLAIGWMALNRIRISPPAAIALGVLGAALLLCQNTVVYAIRPVVWGIPAGMLVLSVVALEDKFGKCWPRFLLFLGDASYTIYLSHILVLCIVDKFLEYKGILQPGIVRTQDAVLATIYCLIACLLVAVPLYLGVERPMNNGLRKGFLRKSKPKSQAT